MPPRAASLGPARPPNRPTRAPDRSAPRKNDASTGTAETTAKTTLPEPGVAPGLPPRARTILAPSRAPSGMATTASGAQIVTHNPAPMTTQ